MSFYAEPGAAVAPHGLDSGIAALCGLDPDFLRIVDTVGVPRFALREPGFPTLLRTILEQQISTAVALALWRRLNALCAPLTPEGLLAMTESDLKRCGFTRQKIAYARHLAESILAGRFSPERLTQLDDSEAMAELVKLKGIGRWTAEIYLLFVLGRPDVMPVGDLALQRAAQRLKNRRRPVDAAGLARMAQRWRPWRSVAACLLWEYYLKGYGLPARSVCGG